MSAGKRAPASRTKAARGAPPSGLTRDRIIRAAIDELDRAGLAAFSIRNLARALGVYPTAIYWHIASKNLILAEVVGHTLAELAPDPRSAWQPYLRALFTRYRAAIQRHPSIAPLVGAHLIGNASIPLGFVEQLLVKLREAGFEREALVGAYNCVVAALVGFATQEYAPIPDDDRPVWQAQVEARLRDVDPRAHPTLAAHLPLLANQAFIVRWQSGAQVPLDASFACYVDVIIAGLEQLAARQR